MTLNERLKTLMEACNSNNLMAIQKAVLDLGDWQENEMESATVTMADLEGCDSDCLKMMVSGYLAMCAMTLQNIVR